MNMAFSDSRAFDTGEVTPGLRPLAWGELCARLTAAQDLRRQQAAAGTTNADATAGSFHGDAARMLEHHKAAQDFVNRTCSISGKGNQGNIGISDETPLIERTPRLADEKNCHD
jgi:hypothetical protein